MEEEKEQEAEKEKESGAGKAGHEDEKIQCKGIT